MNRVKSPRYLPNLSAAVIIDLLSAKKSGLSGKIKFWTAFFYNGNGFNHMQLYAIICLSLTNHETLWCRFSFMILRNYKVLFYKSHLSNKKINIEYILILLYNAVKLHPDEN